MASFIVSFLGGGCGGACDGLRLPAHKAALDVNSERAYNGVEASLSQSSFRVTRSEASVLVSTSFQYHRVHAYEYSRAGNCLLVFSAWEISNPWERISNQS